LTEGSYALCCWYGLISPEVLQDLQKGGNLAGADTG